MPKRKLPCECTSAPDTRQTKRCATSKKQSTKKYAAGKRFGRNLQRRDRVLKKIEAQGGSKKWTSQLKSLNKKIDAVKHKFKLPSIAQVRTMCELIMWPHKFGHVNRLSLLDAHVSFQLCRSISCWTMFLKIAHFLFPYLQFCCTCQSWSALGKELPRNNFAQCSLETKRAWAHGSFNRLGSDLHHKELQQAVSDKHMLAKLVSPKFLCCLGQNFWPTSGQVKTWT